METRIYNKVTQEKDIELIVGLLKSLNKSIVFTNGCFDIVHTAHIEVINKAKELGDILIVAINSDNSVKKLKGPLRPINPEIDRAFLLSNFRTVDYVIIYDEETPIELLKLIKPNFLVKGGDYAEDQIVGHELIKEQGGKVVRIPTGIGKSTTLLLEKLIALDN